jgi:tetratricopeptide (TPR) repeat protein
VAALLFLLIVVGIRVSFPAFAAYFNEQGAGQYASGRIGEAIDNFRRAISLDGDNVNAHYNLANAYEDVLEWDQAFASYQTALRLDPTFAPALSNLARLNMVRRQDYATALALLREADNLELPRGRDDDLVRYSIQVNLARAFLGLELFGEAEVAAQRATGLFREWAANYAGGSMEGASAHCVLAQVYESPKNPGRNDGSALDEWRQCALWGPSQKLIVESSWLGIAEARVRAAEGGTKP